MMKKLRKSILFVIDESGKGSVWILFGHMELLGKETAEKVRSDCFRGSGLGQGQRLWFSLYALDSIISPLPPT